MIMMMMMMMIMMHLFHSSGVFVLCDLLFFLCCPISVYLITLEGAFAFYQSPTLWWIMIFRALGRDKLRA